MPAPTSGGNHRPSRAAAPGILASRTAAPPPQSARRGSSSTHSGSQSLTRGARRTPHPHGTRRTASCQCGDGVVMVWWQCGVGGRGRGGAVAHKPEEQSSPPLPPSPPLVVPPSPPRLSPLCRRRRCCVGPALTPPPPPSPPPPPPPITSPSPPPPPPQPPHRRRCRGRAACQPQAHNSRYRIVPRGPRGPRASHAARTACGAETIPTLRVDTLLCILEHSPLVSFQAFTEKD
jgi:hypothetical protein